MSTTTVSTSSGAKRSAHALELLRLPTPAGALAILLTPEDGVVRAAGFCSPEALEVRLSPALADRGIAAGPTAGPVADAVAAYGDGNLTALNGVPVDQPGTPFLQLAWQALRVVPAGTTSTYTGLATAAGRPTAVRAAGLACARNLIALFVPCHRVVRSDGALGGYLYGLDVKERLLRHEHWRVTAKGTMPSDHRQTARGRSAEVVL